MSEDEAEEILGPVITAIVATIPMPPSTPEQINLLVRLLIGADLELV